MTSGGVTDIPKISLSLVVNLAAGLAFLAILVIAAHQSIGEKQTLWSGDAARGLAVGDAVTIGQMADPILATVNVKTDDQFVTACGRVVFYRDVTFARTEASGSTDGDEWTQTEPLERLKQIITVGEPLRFRLQPPPELTTTITAKTPDGVVTSGGAVVAYQNIAYVKREVAFYVAYPRNVVRDILIIPAFLLWAGVDAMSMFDNRH